MYRIYVLFKKWMNAANEEERKKNKIKIARVRFIYWFNFSEDFDFDYIEMLSISSESKWNANLFHCLVGSFFSHSDWKVDSLCRASMVSDSFFESWLFLLHFELFLRRFVLHSRKFFFIQVKKHCCWFFAVVYLNFARCSWNLTSNIQCIFHFYFSIRRAQRSIERWSHVQINTVRTHIQRQQQQ